MARPQPGDPGYTEWLNNLPSAARQQMLGQDTGYNQGAAPTAPVSQEQKNTNAVNAGQPAPFPLAPLPIVPKTPTQPVTSTASTQQQPKPVSLYQQMIQKRLAGQDPNVLNAQAQQKTNASMTDYAALRNGREQGVQAGFTPGSLQYQRGIDRSQAVAADQNLSGQDRVNALARDTSTQAINDSHTLELDNQKKVDTLINSVTDPKAQAHLRQVQAQGGDVNAAYAGMFGEDGAISTTFRSATPEATKLQGFTDQVQTEHPDWTPEQVQTEAQSRYQGSNRTQFGPTSDADKLAKAKEFESKPWSERDFTSEAGKSYLANLTDENPISAMDNPAQVDDWARRNPNATIKVNGQPYRVVSSNMEWVNDGGKNVKSVEVQNSKGETVYLGQNGKVYKKTADAYTSGSGSKHTDHAAVYTPV